jgi:ATP-dependent exoDNAse (exonuclease V) beta subunit
MAEDFFSISKIQKYTKCSKMYDLHYNQKMYRTDKSDATVIGSLCHEALEAYYREEVEHPIDALNKIWAELLKPLEDAQDELEDLKEDLQLLSWRASADCKDAKIWIRNRDGTVPRALSMNSKYKSEVERLGIDERKSVINQKAFEGIKDWSLNLSLADCYSETYRILQRYKEIPGLRKVLHVELGISTKDGEGGVTNGVTLPISKQHMNGYIDLVAEVNGQLAIIDHKTTSGDAPDMITVMYTDQLLLYAWAYNELYGVKPDYIGINHLKSGKVVLAPLNWSLVEDTLNRFECSIIAARNGTYLKKSPTEYQSPCLGGSKNISEVTRTCPYLDVCHPDLYQIING